MHALCLAQISAGATVTGTSRMREAAKVLVDLGWEVTVVEAGAFPALEVVPEVVSDTDIRVVRVPLGSELGSGMDPGTEQALAEVVARLHHERPVDVTIAAEGPLPWFSASHRLWDTHRIPYVLDHADAALLRRPDGDHPHPEESGDPATEATQFAEALEVWFPDDASRRSYESDFPSLSCKTRMVPVVDGDGSPTLRSALMDALEDLETRVESARALPRLLAARGASGPLEVTVFEIPLPSTRTIRMMDTLRAAGVVTHSIHSSGHTSAVRGLGFRTVSFTNRKYSLLGHVRKHLSAVKTAEPGTPEGRLRELYQAMLDVPVPATRPIWQDLKILSQEWFEVARMMVANPSPVFWAADLNALPPAIWAKHALPGTRVILDAHELFVELDYLDPTQRAEWEEISQTFLPEVDLVITVGQGVADELRRRYGIQRVEVIESRTFPTRFPRSDVRRVVGLDQATPLVVHVGNVSDNRNPLLAVRLLQHDTRMHFAFVGVVRGAMSDTLRDAAEAAGVLDRLHLVDNVPRDELQHFLSSADASAILYSPRTSENLRLAMPNKLFDALGAGVPCVAALGTAAADYLQDEGVGLGFADDDAMSLAASLEAVISDRSLRKRVHDMVPGFLWPSVEPRLLSLVADELGEARLPLVQGSTPATATAETTTPTWRGDPVRRARRALAWRLRRAAGALER